MINILVLDDIEDNLAVMELLIEEYMDDHSIEEYQLFLLQDSTKAADFIKINEIDLLFLDIMMPIINGLELLRLIRDDTTIKQPIIVMATALSGKSTRKKESILGANAFMIKPISTKVLSIMLDKYIEVLSKNTFKVDDMFEFDFDFDDDINKKTRPKTQIDIIVENQSKLPPIDANTFLENYGWNIEVIENKLEHLDYLIFKHFGIEENFNIDMNTNYQSIIEIIDEFHEFLGMFSELDDIQFVLTNLKDILYFNDFKKLDVKNQKYLGDLIKAILIDLIDFKEKIFIDKTVQNIYYANASIASTYAELENLFNT